MAHSTAVKDDIEEQRQAFERFCKDRYGGFDEDGRLGCLKSKTVTRTKGAMIVRALNGDPLVESYSPKFSHWARKRGFKLISHTVLGLKDDGYAIYRSLCILRIPRLDCAIYRRDGFLESAEHIIRESVDSLCRDATDTHIV